MEEFAIDSSQSKKWVDTYRPKTIKDIVGHKYAVSFIRNWLTNYEKNSKIYIKTVQKGKKTKRKKSKKKDDTADSVVDEGEGDMNDIEYVSPGKKSDNHFGRSCMTVSGSHGIGKTCSVIAILNSLGYTINTINFTRIAHSKTPQEFVAKMLRGTNIFNIVSGEKQKKMAVVIDDLESITSSSELAFITALIKENDCTWRFPIIFITNNRHKKFINNVKKSTYEVQMSLPTEKHLEKMLINLCYSNKMILSGQEVVDKIIDHAQYDYRRLLTTLQDLYETYRSKEITEEAVSGYFEFSKRKDIDVDIYKSSGELFSNSEYKIEDRLVIYETERTIMPLMVEQNHIACANRYVPKKKRYDFTRDMTEFIAKGDVIENYIYGDQNWSLQETHGFYTCVLPTHLLSNNINTNTIKNDMHFGYYRPTFPLDLNRTSIKYINVRNVKHASQDFPWMNISDFIYVKTILRKLLDEENYEEYEKILSGYKATPTGVQAVIKVDKILNTKTSIPTSVVRRINQHTGDESTRQKATKKRTPKKTTKKTAKQPAKKPSKKPVKKASPVKRTKTQKISKSPSGSKKGSVKKTIH